MTYFPPEAAPLPIPEDPRAPEAIYDGAHKHFVIAYTDIVLRNPENGELFLPVRDIEPAKG